MGDCGPTLDGKYFWSISTLVSNQYFKKIGHAYNEDEVDMEQVRGEVQRKCPEM